MAASVSALTSSITKSHLKTLHTHLLPHKTQKKFVLFNVKPTKKFQTSDFSSPFWSKYLLPITPNSILRNGYYSYTSKEEENLTFLEEKPLNFLFWVVVWASLSLAWFAASGDANAAMDSSIKASSFGLKIASKLRSSGWPDEAIVFALATLPIIELRGAIPVGYWMQLMPVILTVFAVMGNMVPVPFIILYLKKLATFLAGKSKTASRLLDILFDRAKAKAGPVEEFQWLGLMLFVAVPFPGTGAWTGAIIASILDMPFWSAITANLVGVVLAGLLVNLLVNLGLKYAILTGIILFVVSTFMWNILRSVRKSLSTSS